MTSSRDDDSTKVLTLLQQLRSALEHQDESDQERIDRLEFALERTIDVLTLYGANIFTLAVHQVQILQQLTDLERVIMERSTSKAPALPHLRRKVPADADN
jgi:hypothetical protein